MERRAFLTGVGAVAASVALPAAPMLDELVVELIEPFSIDINMMMARLLWARQLEAAMDDVYRVTGISAEMLGGSQWA